MAGLGRRSHYRKHLTDSVLNDLPEPTENERIAKVVGTRGSNQFELVIDPSEGELDPTPQLAILPTKFRKLVWLKRNDYVISAVVAEDDHAAPVPDTDADAGADADADSTSGSGSGDKEGESSSGTATASTRPGTDGGIRYMISHILYKDQVKHLKDKGLWPKDSYFSDNNEPDKDDESTINRQNKENDKGDGDGDEDGDEKDQEDDEEDEDGIVFNDIDDEYFCNMNRIAKMKIEDSEDESDQDSD